MSSIVHLSHAFQWDRLPSSSGKGRGFPSPTGRGARGEGRRGAGGVAFVPLSFFFRGTNTLCATFRKHTQDSKLFNRRWRIIFW